MRYKWIRLYAFCSFALFVLVFLNTFAFTPVNYDTAYGKFYAEEENSIDFVSIGNSTVRFGISTMEAWKKYGVTSYNICSAPTHPEVIIIAINELARLQTPKVVYIDLFGLTYQNENDMEHFVKNYYDSMPDGEAKDNLREQYEFLQTEKNDEGKSNIELFKYHNEYRNPDFFRVFFYHGHTQYKGFWPKFDVSKRKDDIKLDKDTVTDLPKEGFDYLYKILDTCKKYPNINFVFGKMPRFLTKNDLNDTYMLRSAKPIIESYGYKYEEWESQLDQIGLDKDRHMFDAVHLNANGAAQFTGYLINYFESNFGKFNTTHSQTVIDNFNSAYSEYEKLAK